uniref:VAN3-binding protein-like auxin canalisation domain-containing protein n=1 Tax=Solanum lycopersicum TaxID=4081 RepID=A0A494G994_SOLLC
MAGTRFFTDSVLPLGVGLLCLASSIHDIRQVFRNAELMTAATACTCAVNESCDPANSVRSVTTSGIGGHGGSGDPHDEPKD